MATQGTPLLSPFTLVAPDLVGQLALGDVNTPFEMTALDRVEGLVRANRFPVPPVAWGFLTDVETDMAFSHVQAPYTIYGALFPESPYLEPTIGQIWPR